jgi:hypothetical protein
MKLRPLIQAVLTRGSPQRLLNRKASEQSSMKIARVLVRLDHVPRIIVNANPASCERLQNLGKRNGVILMNIG